MSEATAISFTLPDVISFLPFPCAIHSDRDKGTEESIAWICSEDALGTKDTHEHWLRLFEKWDTPLITAFSYPYATYDKFRLCCDSLNMMYAIDEITEHISGEKTKDNIDTHLRVLFGGDCDGSPISKMTTSVRDRVKDVFRPISYTRFLRDYREYAESVINESHLREKEEILPVDEYIIQRRSTGGLRPLFGLVELCLNLEIPDEVIDHPTLRRMSNAAIDIVHWINDLLSYKKERIQDGPKCANIVTSLMHEKDLPLQGAIDFVGKKIESLTSQFLLDKKALPSFGTTVDEELKAYIMGLEYLIIGTTLFSFESGRYFDVDEREKVKETRIVEITGLYYTDKLTSSH